MLAVTSLAPAPPTAGTQEELDSDCVVCVSEPALNDIEDQPELETDGKRVCVDPAQVLNIHKHWKCSRCGGLDVVDFKTDVSMTWRCKGKCWDQSNSESHLPEP